LLELTPGCGIPTGGRGEKYGRGPLEGLGCDHNSMAGECRRPPYNALFVDEIYGELGVPADGTARRVARGPGTAGKIPFWVWGGGLARLLPSGNPEIVAVSDIWPCWILTGPAKLLVNVAGRE